MIVLFEESAINEALLLRLRAIFSNKHSTAFVDHSSGDVIMTVGTREESIAKHLYSCSDKCAALNVVCASNGHSRTYS